MFNVVYMQAQVQLVSFPTMPDLYCRTDDLQQVVPEAAQGDCHTSTTAQGQAQSDFSQVTLLLISSLTTPNAYLFAVTNQVLTCCMIGTVSALGVCGPISIHAMMYAVIINCCCCHGFNPNPKP